MELTLKEIADSVKGEIKGDDRVIITGINSFDKARYGEVSFLFDQRFKSRVKETKASALLVSELVDGFEGPQVVVSNPKLAYARVADMFAAPTPRFEGISDRAVIDESVRIGENVSIYPMAYVGKEAVIGDDVTVFSGVFIGDRVRIGNGTMVYPNVTIMHDSIIGKDVIIHAGSVIGSDGFGFVKDGALNVKIPQFGFVQIDDQVEIGANNSIDRAAFGKTWIKRGVKTDNLVQIAHNVVIGEDTIIVGQTGISGSVEIGREVVIGGQVGISDHQKIGDRAMIGSKSGVYKSVPPGEKVSGIPTMPHRVWLRTAGLITRLPWLSDRLKSLEKKVEKMEKK